METNMIIGSFEYDAKQDAYLGDIVTLNFNIERVTIKPNTHKGDKDHPDYRVIAPTVVGYVELGAGWKRTSEKGQNFVSVSLDAPLLDAPLNAALFMAENGTEASMVWNRHKAKAKVAASETAQPASLGKRVTAKKAA
jgi:uncharacterized protein (DUF736 family)